ncbi:MAG: hypothetical protein RIT81_26700 [Deltaproteobacteria bacterium]
MATRIRLGELLVRAGVIDELKLKAALSEQQKWGGRLGKILVDMSFVSEDLLVKALSKQLGVSRATFTSGPLPAEIVEKIDIQFAKANELCPEAYDENRRVLVVATADPTNVTAMDELRFRTGLKIETTIAGHREIEAAIAKMLRPVPKFGIELPDSIELSETSSEMQINSEYHAAMAASGLMPDEAATISPDDPGPWNPQARAVTQSASDPDHGAAPPSSTPPGVNGPRAQPGLQATAMGQAIVPGSALDLAGRLDGAQKQQAKALRVMLELLIDKGVFSQDEYLSLVNRR